MNRVTNYSSAAGSSDFYAPLGRGFSVQPYRVFGNEHEAEIKSFCL
ncbi:MAG: hypothetical protein MZV70_38275 [Desulfobacterales bacterium]|nr:hypothetical protein [Desulfobacterales bacterium]